MNKSRKKYASTRARTRGFEILVRFSDNLANVARLVRAWMNSRAESAVTIY